MEEVMPQSLIQVSNEELSWRDAVRLAAKPLLEKGHINESYIDAMIKTVEDMGAYIVLAPKVAVPHARPEKGVKKTGMSLLKLEQAVDFNVEGESDPDRLVQLVFVLAAEDSESHLGVLQKLSTILEDEENIEALIELETVEDLYEKLNAITAVEEEEE